MSYFLNNQQKLNEIIFEKRNKEYGAYAIRSTYGHTLFKSLTYMLLGFGSFILTVYYITRPEPGPLKGVSPAIYDTTTYITFCPLPDPKEPAVKKPDPKPASSAPGGESTSTVIKDTVITVNSNILNDELATTSPSASSVDGGADSGGSPGGNGSVTAAAPEPPKEPLLPYEVDSAPEFEGGLNALYKFLGSQLRYPYRASDAGVGGTVYVKFVVDETGQVIKLSLLNNLGYGLDEEALRVVGLIPKFKTPAKVKGKPVKTYFQLPIRFSQK